MTGADDRILISETAVWTASADGSILVLPPSESIPRRLSGSAVAIWNELYDSPTAAQVINRVLSIYDGDATLIESHVMHFLEDLLSCGAIRTAGEIPVCVDLTGFSDDSPRGYHRRKVVFLDHSGEPGGGQLGLRRYFEAASTLDRSAIFLDGGEVADSMKAAAMNIEVLDSGPSKRGALVSVRKVTSAINRHSPDLVVANSLRAAIVLALCRIEAPKIYYLREDLSDAQLGSIWKRAAVKSMVLSRMDGFIANSAWTRDTLPRWHRVRALCPVAWPVSGISEVRDRRQGSSRASDGFVRFCCVGRLQPWKGQRVVLDAARELVNRGYGGRFSLDFYGGSVFEDSSYESEMRDAAEGVPGVVFHGHVSDVLRRLRDQDVLVHSSLRAEPFGQVIVQGLAAGLPVLTTGMGGAGQIVTDGTNGMTFAPDAKALAQVMGTLMDDRAMLERLAVGASASAEQYLDSLTSVQLDEAIHQLADEYCEPLVPETWEGVA